MSHLNSSTRRRKPAAPAAFISVMLLACLGLAACGSSSGSSSGTNASASTASTATTATTSTTPSGAGGANSGRFAAIRACLKKNGITLPQRTPGQRRPPGAAGGFPGGGAGGAGGPQLPKGVTRTQYEAALKKCGGGNFAGRGRGGARIKSPAFQAALAKFASCLRENGVKVPAPNTSGNGPVFDTKGIDTSSAQFKAAEAKCQSVLRTAFRQGAATGGPGGGEAPPAK